VRRIVGRDRARRAEALGRQEVGIDPVCAEICNDIGGPPRRQVEVVGDDAGYISDSGGGRWTIKAAIDEAVPPHVSSAALYDRLASRGEAEFATKLLPAMRYGFGGHGEKPGG
jgi:hypothetical protein